MNSDSRGRVLMISENEGIPGDRRIWAEARTLSEAGWDVEIVCSHAHGELQLDREVLDGISIRRFRLRPAGGALGYVREYLQALVRIRKLVGEVESEGPIDAVHVANPPDFLRLAARGPLSRGAMLIFDHHDLVPELYFCRYGSRGPVHRLLLAIERSTMRAAEIVISTNDTYRQIAIDRGSVPPANVYVVRNGPDLERFVPVPADPDLKRGKRHLLAYLGVMGRQDGIDHALEALAELRHVRGDDWRACFIGDGEVIDEMRSLSVDLGIDDLVEFVGWRGDDDICRYLSTADVCLAPDPPGPGNDASTMVKLPEYMAMGKAIASYDLPESRVSAGEAASYAASPDPAGLARCIDELLDDPNRRAEMGLAGRERVSELSWEQSAEVLCEAYDHVTRSRAGAATERSGGIPIGSAAGDASQQFR